MTPKFNFVVCSIQEAKDIEELSIDELQGSLLVHEQNFLQQEPEEKALKATTDHFSSTTRTNSGRDKERGTNERRSFNQKPNGQFSRDA